MSRPARSIDARSPAPAARASQRLSWRYACGARPAGRASLRDRPLVARPAALLARDPPLEQPGVGEAAELDPHGVGVALDARRELLGGRGAPQLAEDVEQPRAKRIGEGVVSGRGGSFHALHFLFPFRQ